jgi:hypothetical protein
LLGTLLAALLGGWLWTIRGGENTPVFLIVENAAIAFHERHGRWPNALGETLKEATATEKELVEQAFRRDRVEVDLNPRGSRLAFRYRGVSSWGAYKILRQARFRDGRYSNGLEP